MRCITIILFFFLTTSYACNTNTNQNSIPELNDIKASSTDSISSNKYNIEYIISNIAARNTIEGEYVGWAGSPSIQMNLYRTLNRIATEEELISWTDHKNPVVRYYAFRALVNRNSDKTFKMLLKHMYDTATQVVLLNGCIGRTQTLRYNLIGLVNSKNDEPNGFKLNDNQKLVIYRILNKYPDPIMRPIKP